MEDDNMVLENSEEPVKELVLLRKFVKESSMKSQQRKEKEKLLLQCKETTKEL